MKETPISPGEVNVYIVSFYTSFESTLTEDDKIIELVLDPAGSPLIPYKREHLYHITTAIDFRSDNAKIEYWKYDCYEVKRKFLNGVE